MPSIFWKKPLPFASRWVKTETMPVAAVIAGGVMMCATFCIYQLSYHPSIYLSKKKRLQGLEVFPYRMPYKPKITNKDAEVAPAH